MKKRQHVSFYPCGLKISDNEIFASARNLGLSLMGALTGNATEDVQINRAEISIGLGCFGLVGINSADYKDGADYIDHKSIEMLDENEGWGLCSSIRYNLLDGQMGEGKIIAEFQMLNLNISPSRLLHFDEDDFGAIQLFGPARLLRKLKSGNMRFEMCKEMRKIELGNYLEGGWEPSDGLLTPSEEEYELFLDEDEPQKKFRILLNMITSFASTLSAKLMYYGQVMPSFMHMPSDGAFAELGWFRDGKIKPAWRPTVKEAEAMMKRFSIPMEEVDPSVKEILWPVK